MINRKIAISAVSIFAAFALVAGGTFAYFTDVGTSSDNLFTSGTFDLKLSDDTPEVDQDDVVASFGGTNLAPGTCLASQQLRLKNSGSVAGNHVDIIESNSNPSMAEFLRIDLLDYGGSNITGKIVEQGGDGNAFLDLADLSADTDGLENLVLTDLGINHNLDIVVCLDESATNILQGGANYATFSATLRQQAHGLE